MNPDAADAAVLYLTSQAIEIACAPVRGGGSCGGLRRFPKTQQNQPAAVLRRLRRGAPHTPYALRGAFGARRGRMKEWVPQGNVEHGRLPKPSRPPRACASRWPVTGRGHRGAARNAGRAASFRHRAPNGDAGPPGAFDGMRSVCILGREFRGSPDVEQRAKRIRARSTRADEICTISRARASD